MAAKRHNWSSLNICDDCGLQRFERGIYWYAGAEGSWTLLVAPRRTPTCPPEV